MKIYNKVVIDMNTLDVLEEDSFEYSGPLIEMKGDTDAVDESYNKGMLAISEKQQDWADQFMNYYFTGSTTGYNSPGTISEAELQAKNIEDAYSLSGDETAATRSSLNLTEAQNKAAQGLIGDQTAAEKAGLEYSTAQSKTAQELLSDQATAARAALGLSTAQDIASTGLVDDQTAEARAALGLSTAQSEAALGLLPQQTALEEAEIGERQNQISARSPLISKYYSEALKGEDVTGAMNKAQADVAQSFGAARSSLNRNLALRGAGAASEATQREMAADQARGIAFARSQARQNTTAGNLEKLRSALSLGDI